VHGSIEPIDDIQGNISKLTYMVAQLGMSLNPRNLRSAAPLSLETSGIDFCSPPHNHTHLSLICPIRSPNLIHLRKPQSTIATPNISSFHPTIFIPNQKHTKFLIFSTPPYATHTTDSQQIWFLIAPHTHLNQYHHNYYMPTNHPSQQPPPNPP
jgi:hypothetical protein